MRLHLPNTLLKKEIPGLTRALAQEQVEAFEKLYPGPYRLGGFQPFPPERYGMPKDTFFSYQPNDFDPADPLKRPTKEYPNIVDVYDEIRAQFSEKGMPVPRMKVYVYDARGRIIYIDSQVLDKARKLIIGVRDPAARTP